MATLKFWNAATGAWEYVPSAGNASYSGVVPAGSTTAVINHGLGTTAIAPQCFRTATGELVLPTYTVLDPNRVQLTFAAAPASGEYRVVIISAIPNESPVGTPAINEYFDGSARGTGGLDADFVAHSEMVVIPNPGTYVEVVVDGFGRFAMGPGVGTVEALAKLQVSLDGGATWTDTPISGASAEGLVGTGDMETNSFATGAVIKGTPSGDIHVRALTQRVGGSTSGTVNFYMSGTVTVFTGGHVVLDGRYAKTDAVPLKPSILGPSDVGTLQNGWEDYRDTTVTHSLHFWKIGQVAYAQGLFRHLSAPASTSVMLALNANWLPYASRQISIPVKTSTGFAEVRITPNGIELWSGHGLSGSVWVSIGGLHWFTASEDL